MLSKLHNVNIHVDTSLNYPFVVHVNEGGKGGGGGGSDHVSREEKQPFHISQVEN